MNGEKKAAEPRGRWIIERCFEKRRWTRWRLWRRLSPGLFCVGGVPRRNKNYLLRQAGNCFQEKVVLVAGHLIARISVVVRPVLFFQVLFLSDCRLSLFPSSPRVFLFPVSRLFASRRHGPPDCRRQLRLVLDSFDASRCLGLTALYLR